MDAAEKIKKIRKEKGITQKELAKRLGWSAAHVSQYETGTRIPKHETLVKIASALGCDIKDLMPDIKIAVLPEGVYTGFENADSRKTINIIKFTNYLDFTDFNINLSDNSVAFDGEKYYLTPEQFLIIMNSTEEHIKTLIRAIGKKVEE